MLQQLYIIKKKPHNALNKSKNIHFTQKVFEKNQFDGSAKVRTCLQTTNQDIYAVTLWLLAIGITGLVLCKL